MQKRIYFKGCLFDLDGTLVDSTSAVNRAWTMLAKRNQLNVEYVLSVIHGRPASESINELLSGKTQEHIDAEIVWLQNEETKDTDGQGEIVNILLKIKNSFLPTKQILIGL
ncbi:HAD hydrolase-like protein, partial [Aeromonas caviae]|uniref:HAD family hydrolase n=1 Tax=Aeromonas caviae TaxID=648 RepID=UPI00214F275A|nr:HAD hydrolase-like protein [Aeromonas caviae]